MRYNYKDCHNKEQEIQNNIYFKTQETQMNICEEYILRVFTFHIHLGSVVHVCNLSFDGAVGAELPAGPAVHDVCLAAGRHLVTLADHHQLGFVPSTSNLQSSSISCILTTFSAFP